MSRIVQKYGGTSVGDIERIRAVAGRVKAVVEAGDEIAVVVSAMAGTTNELVSKSREMAAIHDTREYDVVVASGEQVTIGLLAMALQDIGVDRRSIPELVDAQLQAEAEAAIPRPASARPGIGAQPGARPCTQPC